MASQDPIPAAARRLIASAFFMDAGFFLVLAAIPYQVLALGGGAVALGAVPSISSVTYIVTTLAAGRWSDRHGRRRLACWGNACFILFALISSRIGSLPLQALAMPLLGFGTALYWPVVQAAIGDLAGGGRLTRAIGLFNVSWSAGKMLGYLLGGVLLATLGLRGAFAAGALLVAIASVCLPRGGGEPGGAEPAGRPRPQASPPPPAEPGAAPSPERPAAPDAPLRRAFRHMAWIANFAAYGAGGVLNHHLPKWFAVRGWDEWRFGALLALVFLGQTAAFLLLAGRVRFAYSVRRLLLPQAAAAVAMGLLPLAGAYGLLAAAAPLLGAAFGVCYAASIFYSLDTGEGRGRNAGIHESLVGAGVFMVPLLGGIGARLGGWLGIPYLLSACCLWAAVAWQWARWRRAMRAQADGAR